jgi:hypothetical protein
MRVHWPALVMAHGAMLKMGKEMAARVKSQRSRRTLARTEKTLVEKEEETRDKV